MIAVVLIGWLYFDASSRLQDLDAHLCPKSGASSLTVVLVDVTDPLTLPQEQDLKNQLEDLVESIAKHGRLAIFRVDTTSEALLSPTIDVCNPGDGSDLSELNADPKNAYELWQTGFHTPLEKAFGSISQAANASTSPIFESIQSVALTHLQTATVKKRPRKLVVISDLLQNTEAINFYQKMPVASDLLASPGFLALRTDLRGVEVELWMLSRPRYADRQTTALIDLWQALLVKQGARVIRAYNVSG